MQLINLFIHLKIYLLNNIILKTTLNFFDLEKKNTLINAQAFTLHGISNIIFKKFLFNYLFKSFILKKKNRSNLLRERYNIALTNFILTANENV